MSTTDELMYSEPIVRVFGKPSNVRILTVLSDANGQYLPVETIAEQADTSKQTVYNNASELKRLDLIEPGYRNNKKCYRLPRDDEETDVFEQLRDILIDNDP